MSALNQSDNLSISELIKVLKVRKNKLASTAIEAGKKSIVRL